MQKTAENEATSIKQDGRAKADGSLFSNDDNQGK